MSDEKLNEGFPQGGSGYDIPVGFLVIYILIFLSPAILPIWFNYFWSGPSEVDGYVEAYKIVLLSPVAWLVSLVFWVLLAFTIATFGFGMWRRYRLACCLLWLVVLPLDCFVLPNYFMSGRELNNKAIIKRQRDYLGYTRSDGTIDPEYYSEHPEYAPPELKHQWLGNKAAGIWEEARVGHISQEEARRQVAEVFKDDPLAQPIATQEASEIIPKKAVDHVYDTINPSPNLKYGKAESDFANSKANPEATREAHKVLLDRQCQAIWDMGTQGKISMDEAKQQIRQAIKESLDEDDATVNPRKK